MATAWWRGHPLVFDALVAVALAALTVSSLWLMDTRVEGVEFREPDALAVALVLATCAPLTWRRRAPVVVFAVVTVTSVLLEALTYAQAFGGVPVLIAVYTCATLRSTRASAAVLAGSMVAFGAVIYGGPYPFGVIDAVATSGVFIGAWAVGRTVRIRRAYTADLEERARQLENAREADTRAAIAEERSRIARELHDVVAHHVSVMTVQAAAAQRTIERNPEAAREAMAAVETTGRAALIEMRSIVGVLREGDVSGPGTLEPQPGVGDVSTLVEQLTEAGLPVSVEREGIVRPLPAGIDLAAFRIVQEGLTNVLKHAGSAKAALCLRYGAREITIRITDDGRGAAARLDRGAGAGVDRGAADMPDSGPGLGHGLIGMRERVALYGGELRAGPRPGGGWEVEARLPISTESGGVTSASPAGPADPAAVESIGGVPA